MRVLILVAFTSLVLLRGTPAGGAVFPDGRVNAVRGERIPGVLIVRFAHGTHSSLKTNGSREIGLSSVDELNAKFGLEHFRPLFPENPRAESTAGASELRGFYVFDFSPDADLERVAAEYRADPSVMSVEFDYYAYIMRTPDDTQFPSMLNLDNVNDRDIDAPEAWDRVAGSPTVVLADTDTGVLYDHEDLNANIWVNPGEDLDGDGVVWDLDDIDSIDNDGNGYVDDLIGWDFVSGGSAVWPGEDGLTADNDPRDFHGHGTHTSGTIAATTNNAVGVAGVAGGFGPSEPGCKIMCLRMGYSFNDDGGENGRTHMSYVAEAFRYAADNGAVAINYSFGSSEGFGIELATDYAVAAGLVISASAGNDGNSSFGYLQSRSDVLCVASVTSNDIRSNFSNYGPEVDVSAPGSSIRSTVSSHYSPGYAIFSGTSMAAPHVVGLVGLIKSLNPLLTGPEIIARIVGTTDNIDALNPAVAGLLGSGRINAASALVDIASVDFTGTPVVGDAPLTVDFADLSGTPATGWTWDFGDGDSAFTQDPSHVFPPGLHSVSLRTQTGIGDGFHLRTNYIASLAETLQVASTEGVHGQPVSIEIRMTNNLPITELLLPIKSTHVGPSASATFDSLVYSGCRTEHFESKQTAFNNMFFGEVAVRLKATITGATPPLEPGSGPVATAWFTVLPGASPANFIEISTDTVGGVFGLEIKTPTVSLSPVSHPGQITIPYLLGDLNFDGIYNVLDVVSIVNIIFRNGPLPDPAAVADINCDGQYNVLDVVLLVGTVFRNAPPPVCP